MNPRIALVALAFLPAVIARAAEEYPFEAPVLNVRPRIFLRDDSFEGLTIEKLRARLRRPGPEDGPRDVGPVARDPPAERARRDPRVTKLMTANSAA